MIRALVMLLPALSMLCISAIMVHSAAEKTSNALSSWEQSVHRLQRQTQCSLCGGLHGTNMHDPILRTYHRIPKAWEEVYTGKE